MSKQPQELIVRMLRLPEVKNLTGIASSDTIYRLIRQGKFPKQRKLTERSSAWRSDEIQQWIESRPTSGAA